MNLIIIDAKPLTLSFSLPAWRVLSENGCQYVTNITLIAVTMQCLSYHQCSVTNYGLIFTHLVRLWQKHSVNRSYHATVINMGL